jgi:hypothetical protein
MKQVPAIVWIIPAFLLAVAVARLPYGYYTFTRIVTCLAAAWIAIESYKSSSGRGQISDNSATAPLRPKRKSSLKGNPHGSGK